MPLVVVSTILSECLPPLLEGVGRMPKYRAPWGALYVKPGMTREQRLQDFAACGNHGGLRFYFTSEQIEEVNKIPVEVLENGRGTGKFIFDGTIFLIRKLNSCMESKGYIQLPAGSCDSDEGYPPQCMCP
jgi:hypothetical protein